MLLSEIVINGRRIGPEHPVYIIAEISANHKQKYDEAVMLLRAAKDTGADAVKLQTYTPDSITMNVDSPVFRHDKESLWSNELLYKLYERAYMPWEWQPRLKAIADELQITLFSSPFDVTAIDFLETLSVPAYKIASFELVDIPLIKKAARTGKPVIVSTGMGTLCEIEEAVQAAREAGARELALLKCTSAYPASPGEINLRTIADFSRRFGLPIGLSDHTLGIHVAVAAVASGAQIIEKHITLSRSKVGPDSAFSLEPNEFKSLVVAVRQTEEALGAIRYEPTEREGPSRRFRRSLFVVEDVRAGEAITSSNIRSIRPAAGILPKHYDEVLGRRFARDVKHGTPLTWDLLV
jgi:N-acetylneuraminate synthase